VKETVPCSNDPLTPLKTHGVFFDIAIDNEPACAVNLPVRPDMVRYVDTKNATCNLIPAFVNAPSLALVESKKLPSHHLLISSLSLSSSS
jgi:hypothetical protein